MWTFSSRRTYRSIGNVLTSLKEMATAVWSQQWTQKKASGVRGFTSLLKSSHKRELQITSLNSFPAQFAFGQNPNGRLRIVCGWSVTRKMEFIFTRQPASMHSISGLPYTATADDSARPLGEKAADAFHIATVLIAEAL